MFVKIRNFFLGSFVGAIIGMIAVFQMIMFDRNFNMFNASMIFFGCILSMAIYFLFNQAKNTVNETINALSKFSMVVWSISVISISLFIPYNIFIKLGAIIAGFALAALDLPYFRNCDRKFDETLMIRIAILNILTYYFALPTYLLMLISNTFIGTLLIYDYKRFSFVVIGMLMFAVAVGGVLGGIIAAYDAKLPSQISIFFSILLIQALGVFIAFKAQQQEINS